MSKRRRVNKACVYCHRSHLMCDAERPCGRCRKRNIPHLCRDEEEDMHSLYRTMVAGVKNFQQNIREERQRQGILEPPSGRIYNPGSVASSEVMEDSRTPRIISQLEDFAESTDLREGGGGSHTTSDGESTEPLFNSFSDKMKAMDQATFGGFMGLGGLDQNTLQQLILAAERGRVPPGMESMANAISALREKLQAGGSVREVLSATKLLKYYEGVFNMNEYFSTRLSREHLSALEAHLTPLRDKFLEKLLLLDYSDALAMTQSFERKVLSFRKYFATLSLPGMVLRRTGEVCLISDALAEMLGYTREDLMVHRHVHEMIPVDHVVDFITKIVVPMLQHGGSDTVVHDLHLARANGTPLRTRASLSVQRGIQGLPLCLVALLFPLDPPVSVVCLPDLVVLPSTFSPSRPTLESLLFDSIEPGSGVTVEDVQRVMRM